MEVAEMVEREVDEEVAAECRSLAEMTLGEVLYRVLMGRGAEMLSVGGGQGMMAAG